jgi:dienelactone hydrolase
LAGQRFIGRLALDKNWSGQRPGVLVAPTWAGRGAFEEDKCRQLAGMGYAAMALDIYGDGRRGADPEENAALMAPLLSDRATLQARMGAARDALATRQEADEARLAAIGYCFGGLCVLDLARSGAPLRGVVSLHGLFTPADNLPEPQVQARVLCLHGYDDPMVPPEAMLGLAEEMTRAGADWQLHAYGNTVHAFTNPAAADAERGTVYSETADRRSWQAVENFLAEVLA